MTSLWRLVADLVVPAKALTLRQPVWWYSPRRGVHPQVIHVGWCHPSTGCRRVEW